MRVFYRFRWKSNKRKWWICSTFVQNWLFSDMQIFYCCIFSAFDWTSSSQINNTKLYLLRGKIRLEIDQNKRKKQKNSPFCFSLPGDEWWWSRLIKKTIFKSVWKALPGTAVLHQSEIEFSMHEVSWNQSASFNGDYRRTRG